ncbi:MAG: diphthine synthase [Candidatus Bathyarchaeota archaeon]|nr:diphthine synthase [Candidatus Bathyarchaeota archaeon]MDH5786772.1 diphthine synthase [Candidatus Bathyarchaeota archaeon]
MTEIVFIGLGLHDEMGISLRGLEEIKTADTVFIELYTNLLPNFSTENFQKISGKTLTSVSRKELEEEGGQKILRAAETGKAVLLVPGDPLIATTHIALRLEAEKKRIKTHIIHGASIISAVEGLSGLHNYKFGKSVTVPFPENFSETPYEVITQNRKLELHTLCLLDIQVEKKRCLSIKESLESLLKIEEKNKKRIITMKTLGVGIARAGSKNPIVKADFLENLLNYDFGAPPYSVIFPGKLHFMEAEALIVLAGAPKKVMEMAK